LGLIGYVLNSLKLISLGMDPDVVTGLAFPIVFCTGVAERVTFEKEAVALKAVGTNVNTHRKRCSDHTLRPHV
jgi:predicted alpha/beta-hydrolase family hydrolase